MKSTSILAKAVVDAHLRTARQNLERDGFLQPALFLHLAGDQTLVMPLSLPKTSEQKASYFLHIGRYLVERGLVPSEALLLSESWWVAVQEAPAALEIPPSEHPSRRQAIILIGRSADNRRYAQVVQPYTRDAHKRPVWQPVQFAVYEEDKTAEFSSVGLLDYLFEAIPTATE